MDKFLYYFTSACKYLKYEKAGNMIVSTTLKYVLDFQNEHY
jgi:hypothetical protein